MELSKNRFNPLIIASLIIAFLALLVWQVRPTESAAEVQIFYESPYDSIFKVNPDYREDGFDFPVGKPDAKNYYNAQKFGVNNHLGDDWNGVKGGNSDLGDPVYSIANGLVISATNEGPGWGNVVRVLHRIKNEAPFPYVESLYAHLDAMTVKKGNLISRGMKLGTIGTANGAYKAHLHLELRWEIDLPIGAGYSSNSTGFLDPTEFIKGNRPK